MLKGIMQRAKEGQPILSMRRLNATTALSTSQACQDPRCSTTAAPCVQVSRKAHEAKLHSIELFMQESQLCAAMSRTHAELHCIFHAVYTLLEQMTR